MPDVIYGDDAAAEEMALVASVDDIREAYNEINRTRDFVAQFFGAGKAYALGLFSSISLSWASITGKPSTFPPSSHSHKSLDSVGGARFGDAADVGGSVGWTTGQNVGVFGHIYLPYASGAVSSYTVAYINGDGRVSKGVSSERYKKFISEIDPMSLGEIFPDLHRYQIRTGDGSWRYGYIAERLAESEDLQPFVIYDQEDRPDSIDFIALLMAQNAQINARLKAAGI